MLNFKKSKTKKQNGYGTTLWFLKLNLDFENIPKM